METKTVRRTGVIGLGAMGLQMARHMVSKGFEVTGYDIDVDAMRRAIEHGATTCLSPAQVGDHAEVVIVMVASDQQVEEVVAQSVLLDRLQPGSVICIASSCAPETCRLWRASPPRTESVCSTARSCWDRRRPTTAP